MTASRMTADGWPSRAACRGMDTGLWFPISTVAPPDPLVVATCAGCPVRIECLDYAISRPEKSGTWGGMNEDERAAERRRRMRRGEAAA